MLIFTISESDIARFRNCTDFVMMSPEEREAALLAEEQQQQQQPEAAVGGDNSTSTAAAGAEEEASGGLRLEHTESVEHELRAGPVRSVLKTFRVTRRPSIEVSATPASITLHTSHMTCNTFVRAS